MALFHNPVEGNAWKLWYAFNAIKKPRVVDRHYDQLHGVLINSCREYLKTKRSYELTHQPCWVLPYFHHREV